MPRNMITKPKFKICRRLGPGVYDKCQTSKFSASTGASPSFNRRPKALSEYASQLIEKQKLDFLMVLMNDNFQIM